MTTPEKNLPQAKNRLVDLAVELDEQLKSRTKEASDSAKMKLAKDRVSDLSAEELTELSEASEVLAFLNQVRNDISLLNIDTESLAASGGVFENASEESENSLGEKLGRFQIHEALGQGGFARVFRAFDPLLDRDVALKIPRPESLSSEEACSRFVREGKAAAMLSHPAIVTVFEAGKFGPVHYIASALCSGETLCDWQAAQDRPVPIRESATIVAKLADAIHHAHQRGIIHRDLKPSNVMIDKENVGAKDNSLVDRLRITDFGLAKQFENEKSMTLTLDGSVIGTPAYMSPEQVRCEPGIGPATDVYSLGVILHELLTGSPPHKRNTITATIRAIDIDPVPPLRQSRPEIPDSLDAICHKCLERNLTDRYESAFALAEDLNRYLNDQPILAKPAGPLKRLAKWAKRNPGIATSLLVTFASLLAGVAVSWTMYQRAETDRVAAVVAEEEKSQALELAEDRVREMNDQMDLLVGIFDKLNNDDAGNFSKELLLENLRDNLADAADKTFDSTSDPSLRTRLAARISYGLVRLGFEKESEAIATRALELGKENGLSESELLDLELYAALSHPHAFKKIVESFAPKVEQIIANDSGDEMKKVQALQYLVYAYDNLPDPAKALSTQRRLVSYQASLRQKMKHSKPENDSLSFSDVRKYFQSDVAARDEVTSRFYIANNAYKLDNSESNLNELIDTRDWIEEKLGRKDWTTIGTSYVVALLLGEAGKPEEALKVGESAYRNSVEAFGRAHYQTITAANALMVVCGDHRDIEACKKRLPTISAECESCCRLYSKEREESPQVIQILGNVASAYGQLGDFDKAIAVQRGVVATVKKHYNEEHDLYKEQDGILNKLVLEARNNVPARSASE